MEGGIWHSPVSAFISPQGWKGKGTYQWRNMLDELEIKRDADIWRVIYEVAAGSPD